MSLNREEVYKLIDGERDYQDNRWGGREHDAKHSLGDFILYIEYYLSEAKACYTGDTNELSTDNLRKVAALAVAAMEQFGAPTRGGSVFSKMETDFNGNPFNI